MRSRLATVPNALTIVRIACLPLFLRMAQRPERRARAAVMLGALGLTDGLDGYIARRFDQASELGRIADPLVDRAFVLAAMRAALRTGAVPPWLAWVVGARELTAAAGAGVAVVKGHPPVQVSAVGKAGAFAMMVAVPLFLLGTVSPWRRLRFVAWVFALGGQVCAWAALVGYARAGFVGSGA